MTVGDTIQSKNGAGLGGVVTSVNGETGPVDVTASSGVASVDGQTGVVVLSGTYLALAGGTLTGLLTATKGILVSPATSSSIGFAVVGLAGQTGNLTSWLDSSLATLASVNAAGVIAGAGFIVGSNASSTGGVRMPSLSAVNWRNAANNADIGGISTNASDQLQLGTTTVPDADNTKSLGASAKRWATVVTVALITGGTSPAVSGAVRLNNNTGMVGRNAANNADVAIIGINASDKAEVGTDLVGSSDALRTLGSSAVRWAGLHLANFVAVGTNPSSSGAVRLANNSGIASRNAANNADVSLLALNASDVATVGAPLTSTGEIIGTRFAPSTATGATAAARYFRATASGAPASGTWVTGDVVPAQDGTFWHCTAGGTPGTWVQSGSATYAPLASPTFTGVATTPALSVTGLTGAVTATRYVGGTASVAPTTGTFSTGDWVVTANGKIFVCTAGGSPGTWGQVGGGSVATDAIFDAKGDMAVGTGADAAAKLTVGTNGKVPVANSNSSSGLIYANVTPSLARVGGYTRAGGTSANNTQTANRLYYSPILLSRRITWDRIAVNHAATTAGAGSVIRLGVYNNATTGYDLPDALAFDAGTVAADSAPAFKTITISQALDPGLYWLAVVVQWVTTAPSMAAYVVQAMESPVSDPATITANSGFYYQDTVTGTLPANATPSANMSLYCPVVWLRAS